MSENKLINFGSEGRDKLCKGLDDLANAVKVTLGPKGRNVILMREYGTHHVTKDGVTVARDISFKDPTMNMGAQIIKDVAVKTNDEAGDGTTTSIILTQALVNIGKQYLGDYNNPIEISRGMKLASSLAAKFIQDKISKEIGTDLNKVQEVATISANNDKHIGKLIRDAIEFLGKDGVITVDKSTSFDTYIERVEGLKIDRGFVSPYFIKDLSKGSAELLDPYIFITDKILSANTPEMIKFLEFIHKSGKPLIIVAEDIVGEFLQTLIMNKMRGTLDVVAIKSPGFGDLKLSHLEDLAAMTSATVVSDVLGNKLENFNQSWLGRSEKIQVTKNNTVFINSKMNVELVKSRLDAIEVEIKDDETSKYSRDRLKERKSNLKSGVVILRIGAESELEQMEVRDRVDDALSATRASMDSGVVPGGGITFLAVEDYLKSYIHNLRSSKNHDLTEDFINGVEIVSKSLTVPLRIMCKNSGISYESLVSNSEFSEGKFIGMNLLTGQYGDPFEMGILDPTKVVLSAISNSVSVAATFLTTDCVVYDELVEKKD